MHRWKAQKTGGLIMDDNDALISNGALRVTSVDAILPDIVAFAFHIGVRGNVDAATEPTLTSDQLESLRRSLYESQPGHNSPVNANGRRKPKLPSQNCRADMQAKPCCRTFRRAASSA